MDKILTDFGVEPILLVAQVVNFVILLLLLKKFAYGPILKVLEKRKETIAQSLKNAEEIELKLQKTETDREKKLEEAAKEARQVLEEATKSAQQIIAEAHVKASQDMEDIMQKGKESIKMEKEKMQEEVRSELADIVVMSLKKVVSDSLDAKMQKVVIDRAVKKL